MSTKTTIYLPDELKAAVEREAKLRGSSEAEVIRERDCGSGDSSAAEGWPHASGEPIAERVDELLKGFGER